MQGTEYHRSTEAREIAQQAAREGLAVFPVRGKVPVLGKCPDAKAQGLTGKALATHARTCKEGHGFHDASRDTRRIGELFDDAPGATGYGIAGGAASGNLIVLDIDGPAGVERAKRMGLNSGRIVKTGRDDGGYQLHYRAPDGVRVPSFDLADGVEVKAEGAYVVGPGSLHPSGRRYRVVRNGDPSPLPDFIVEAAPRDAGPGPERSRKAGGPVFVDTGGPPIPDGGRNRELARIAGRLHDGTRDRDQLRADLEAVNAARCVPPLPSGELAKIAASIHGRQPCNPRPGQDAGARVQVIADALEAVERPIRGTGGASSWAVYMAGLQLLRRYGREHPDGAALSADVRTWARIAGTGAGTVSKVIARSPLMRRVDRGSGRRGGTVVFVVPDGLVPEGHQRKHSTTTGLQENPTDRSVSASALTPPDDRSVYPSAHPLYRLRWSTAGRPAGRGVAAGTRHVRQGIAPAREGTSRIGKSRAAILQAVADRGDGVEASRQDLAERLGRKAASMRAPLRWLVEAGLLLRVRRGYYALPDDFAQRVEDVRELGGEPEADRRQIAQHDRDRDAYRRRGEVRPERAPSEREMQRTRENAPRRRRDAIERAIARLFADYPEYRGRRVGQITARLVHYIGPDFPRGTIGVPKDHEVETILDGVAA